MFAEEPLAVLALTVSLATVLALIAEIHHNGRLSRRSSSLNYLSQKESRELEIDLEFCLANIGIRPVANRRTEPFTDGEARAMIGDADTAGVANAMLNHLENIAIAREYGLVEHGVWNEVHRGRLEWWAVMLRSYIHSARDEYGIPDMWAAVERQRLISELPCKDPCGAQRRRKHRPWCRSACKLALSGYVPESDPSGDTARTTSAKRHDPEQPDSQP